MTPGAIDEQDREEMRQLVAGHDAALNSLMERHGERLFNYLLRHLGNESDAADLAQETFARVYLHRVRFDPKQKFTTWLYTIATNLLRDRFRWQKRHPQVSLDVETEEGTTLRDTFAATAAAPDEHLVKAERARVVQNAVASLPEELRTPLLLSEYENLSHAEIGAILNCTAKAVETRLYRARANLRKQLAALLPGLS